MKFFYIRLILAVTLLLTLLLAVIIVARYSNIAAVLLWFSGSIALNALKLLKVEKLFPPQQKKLDLLDTEYAAIVAASHDATGHALYNPELLVRDINSYRSATKACVKDVLLYRIGNYLQLFSQTENDVIALLDWRLDDEGRQRVFQALFERFGVTI